MSSDSLGWVIGGSSLGLFILIAVAYKNWDYISAFDWKALYRRKVTPQPQPQLPQQERDLHQDQDQYDIENPPFIAGAGAGAHAEMRAAVTTDKVQGRVTFKTDSADSDSIKYEVSSESSAEELPSPASNTHRSSSSFDSNIDILLDSSQYQHKDEIHTPRSSSRSSSTRRYSQNSVTSSNSHSEEEGENSEYEEKQSSHSTLSREGSAEDGYIDTSDDDFSL